MGKYNYMAAYSLLGGGFGNSPVFLEKVTVKEIRKLERIIQKNIFGVESMATRLSIINLIPIESEDDSHDKS